MLPLTLVLLLLHVLEIGGRRLLLFAAAREWWRHVKLPRPRLPKRRPWRPRPAAPPADVVTAPAENPPAVTAPPKPALSPLARAKARARGRMRG